MLCVTQSIFSDSTIYPGLSTPKVLPPSSAASKLAERKPTPPRGAKVPGTGVFSDITAEFSSSKFAFLQSSTHFILLLGLFIS